MERAAWLRRQLADPPGLRFPATMPEPPRALEEPHYRIDVHGDYAGSLPIFADREECPWLPVLESNWKVIREEYEAYVRADEPTAPFIPYAFEIPGWRSINLVTYRWRYHRNRRRFPRTVEILESIPHLTSAFLNLLEPHSRLPAHFGDSNAICRSHLGLIVPRGAERCGLQVGSERRGWQEGQAFGFCEAYEHFVWNDTDQPRVILVCDVMRPEYVARTGEICGNVLGAMALTLAQTRSRRVASLPPRATRRLHRSLGAGFRALLPLQRRLPWP